MGFLNRALSPLGGLVAKANPVPQKGMGMSPFSFGAKGSRGTPDSFLRAYGDDPWVHGAVSTIAQTISETTWHLYRQQTGGDREEIEGEHPLKQLLNHPNADQTGQDLVELSIKFELLLGKSFWVMIGEREPTELWLVPAGGMKPILAGNAVSGYLYTVGSEQKLFRREEIIPFVHTDPWNLLDGVGPTQPVSIELDMHNYMRQYNRFFFFRNADPGTVVSYKDDISQDEAKRLADKYNAEHQGYGRSHGLLVVGGGATVTREGPTGRDMQFVQLSANVRDTMLGSYSLSYASLGGLEHANRAATEGQIYRYMSNVIRPKLQFLRRKLNQFLVPRFGADLVLDYDDPTPENIEQQSTLVTQRVAAGEMSLEEARQALGDGDIQPEDHFLIPINMQVIQGKDLLAAQTIEPPPTNGKRAPSVPKASARTLSGGLISGARKPTKGRW